MNEKISASQSYKKRLVSNYIRSDSLVWTGTPTQQHARQNHDVRSLIVNIVTRSVAAVCVYPWQPGEEWKHWEFGGT